MLSTVTERSLQLTILIADIETTAIQAYLDYSYSIYQGYILAKAERKCRYRQHRNVSSSLIH